MRCRDIAQRRPALVNVGMCCSLELQVAGVVLNTGLFLVLATATALLSHFS